MSKLKKKEYEQELKKLQVELVKLQEWVKHKGLKVVVLFEGRDAAGKGGVIKRITEKLNHRVCRVVALPAPTEKERHNGTFNVMSRTCHPPVKSSCLTAVGITELASKKSWAFVRQMNMKNFCALALNSRECCNAQALFCSSTGFRSPTRSRKNAS